MSGKCWKESIKQLKKLMDHSSVIKYIQFRIDASSNFNIFISSISNYYSPWHTKIQILIYPTHMICDLSNNLFSSGILFKLDNCKSTRLFCGQYIDSATSDAYVITKNSCVERGSAMEKDYKNTSILIVLPLFGMKSYFLCRFEISDLLLLLLAYL
jgi:hypothetical protein